MEVGAISGILVRDKAENHRACVAVVDEVTHQACHRNKLDVGVLADALEKLIHNFVAQLVIDGNECVVGKSQAHHAAKLPGPIVGSHKDSILALHSLHRWLGIGKCHSMSQHIVAHTRLAYCVDNLLGEVLVAAAADAAKLLLALVGERVTQIAHYHLAAVSKHIGQQQIEQTTYQVVPYKVG